MGSRRLRLVGTSQRERLRQCCPAAVVEDLAVTHDHTVEIPLEDLAERGSECLRIAYEHPHQTGGTETPSGAVQAKKKPQSPIGMDVGRYVEHEIGQDERTRPGVKKRHFFKHGYAANVDVFQVTGPRWLAAARADDVGKPEIRPFGG